ncbi:hypothetical protein IEQ34_011223 [Dendrobium chrysotoxum]|uniref:Uncharacterized protein n=1 Tax=Dendrobium chrysotoxum TaxID=161865 RepID=A0AAV7GFI5_DENCH|nr:hypothetical protein IEQ34_011223 [Dendrobium chrysotoxum]
MEPVGELMVWIHEVVFDVQEDEGGVIEMVLGDGGGGEEAGNRSEVEGFFAGEGDVGFEYGLQNGYPAPKAVVAFF